jgi:FkbM family methyltransferase
VTARSVSSRAVRWALRNRRTVRVLGGLGAGGRIRYVPGDTLLSAVVGRWEPWAQRAMRRLVRRGDTCWDVGANAGTHALALSRLVGPSGSVFAVEPHPRSFALLCENVRLNRARNVTALRLAAGSVDGAATLRSPLGTPGSRLLASLRRETGDESVEVVTRRLDDLREEGALAPPRFVKVDVEGFDAEVLEGMSETLRAFRPALLVEVSGPRTLALLAREGYATRRLASNDVIAVPRREGR